MLRPLSSLSQRHKSLIMAFLPFRSRLYNVLSKHRKECSCDKSNRNSTSNTEYKSESNSNSNSVKFINETEVFQRHKPVRVDNDDDSNLKTILLWTFYYTKGGYSYEFGSVLGRSSFIAAGCKENRCLTTSRKDLEHSAHVIVFNR